MNWTLFVEYAVLAFFSYHVIELLLKYADSTIEAIGFDWWEVVRNGLRTIGLFVAILVLLAIAGSLKSVQK